MCGIAGIALVDGRVDGAVLAAARDTLESRGPDDTGLYISPDERVGLGFRRLSIIDLSAAGAQPMANEDGSVRLVFNGEIYNFRSLRRELEAQGHVFRSAADSEVLVHLYEAMGPAMVQRLTGMFAFAVWDEQARRIVLARDRLGIKPLYYAWDGRRLLFASELRSILAWPDVRRRVDHGALSDYLTYGYVPHDRCIVAGVRKLPAAHVAVLELDTPLAPVPQPYWEPGESVTVTDPADAAEGVAERLSAAVGEQLVADVPLGLFLSGGVDSSSVLAGMARHSERPVEAYGIGFGGRPQELADARLISEAFGANFHSRVVDPGDARAGLGLLAEIYDEPLLDSSAIPTYHVSRLASEALTVALSGDGGDEVFGGYRRYARHLANAERRQTRGVATPLAAGMLAAVLPGLRRLPYLTRLAALERTLYRGPEEGYFRHIGLFDGWEQRRLLGRAVASGMDGRDPLWLLRRFYRPDLPGVTALRYLDLKTYLPDQILVKVDRASMYCSLEVRPPLLDHHLVEYAFSLDDRLFIEAGRGKQVLRDAVRDRLPAGILEAPKTGFGSPIRRWLRDGLADQALDGLESWTIVEAELIQPRYVRRFMRDRAFNRWAKLWSLMVLEGWHRRWIVGEASTGAWAA